MANLIPQRIRYYIAVEGSGEQSFIKWLGEIANQNGLHVTLDCQVLNGGGYESMLRAALRYRERRERKKAKASILLVDADRSSGRDDGWTIEQLRVEAAKTKFILCIQHPNQEGLFYRMIPGNEAMQPPSSIVKSQLCRIWPEYQKPVDARTLSQKFTLSDLQRASIYDVELKSLLQTIGL